MVCSVLLPERFGFRLAPSALNIEILQSPLRSKFRARGPKSFPGEISNCAGDTIAHRRKEIKPCYKNCHGEFERNGRADGIRSQSMAGRRLRHPSSLLWGEGPGPYLLPKIQAFFESEEGQREYAEWKVQQEAQKAD